jgi:CubicO group peptidase (beta-lactamase class C family)
MFDWPKRACVALMLMSSLSGTLWAADLTRADAEAFFDGIMSQRLERDDIAGAAAVVVKDGAVLFEKGYGYADVARKIPVSPDTTLFGIASISKTFVGTAVMQLVAEGKLDLDVDVERYLDFKLKRTFPEPITLRRLLTHTAGFEEGGKDDLDPPGKISTLGPFLATHQPAQIFAPGSRIAYSNYGASLAGYVVERVAKEPFAAYVAQHIYQPLGMDHSTFEAPLPARLAPLASQEYWLGSQPPWPIEYLGRRPAGGMFSTAGDMGKYMIAHLQNGRYGDQRILTDEAARTMHTIQWRGHSDAPGIAISFYQAVGNGRFVLTHGGDLACQHSDLWLIPAEHVGVFVIFNSTGKDWTRIRGSIWRAFLERYFPPLDPGPPRPSSTAHADALAVAGNYLTTRRAQTSILSISFFLSPIAVQASSDDTISLQGATYDNGVPKKYVALGHLLFRGPDGQIVSFGRGSDGAITTMIIDGVAEFERQQGVLNGQVQAKLFLLALATVTLSVLLWPIQAFARWRLQRPLREELEPPARRRRLIVRGTTLVALAMAGLGLAYLLAISRLELTILSASTDPYIRLFQLLAILVVVGSVHALWSAAVAWGRREGSLLYRVGATATAVALVTLALFVVSYPLLTIQLNY